ncbi:unnamed protein product [Rhizopus microsporus]
MITKLLKYGNNPIYPKCMFVLWLIMRVVLEFVVKAREHALNDFDKETLHAPEVRLILRAKLFNSQCQTKHDFYKVVILICFLSRRRDKKRNVVILILCCQFDQQR